MKNKMKLFDGVAVTSAVLAICISGVFMFTTRVSADPGSCNATVTCPGGIQKTCAANSGAGTNCSDNGSCVSCQTGSSTPTHRCCDDLLE